MTVRCETCNVLFDYQEIFKGRCMICWWKEVQELTKKLKKLERKVRDDSM